MQLTQTLYDQHNDAEHHAYFEGQWASTEEFWRRFDRVPDLGGRRVMDFGCGHGVLSLDAARRGAQVLGVDLDQPRVDFARRQLADAYPDEARNIELHVVDVRTMAGDAQFDVVLSKDTMEHVQDLDGTAVALFRLLKPRGTLWIGTSPLYYSPWGDHGRTGMRVPWAHAVLPRRVVLEVASRHNRRPVRTLSDIDLNGMTAPSFLGAFDRAGFEIESLVYNAGDKRGMSVLRAARRVPFLERLATVGIYVVFRRP